MTTTRNYPRARSYQGRHWAASVSEPTLFWLFLTTALPTYIYNFQKNRKNFRIKFGYIPIFLFVLIVSVVIGESVGWHDLAMNLLLKKYSFK